MGHQTRCTERARLLPLQPLNIDKGLTRERERGRLVCGALDRTRARLSRNASDRARVHSRLVRSLFGRPCSTAAVIPSMHLSLSLYRSFCANSAYCGVYICVSMYPRICLCVCVYGLISARRARERENCTDRTAG